MKMMKAMFAAGLVAMNPAGTGSVRIPGHSGAALAPIAAGLVEYD